MKKTIPTLCAGLLVLIFVFGLTTNFVKAATASTPTPISPSKTFSLSEIANKLISARLIDANSRLDVNKIVEKLVAAKLISTDKATLDKVRALFQGVTTPPTARVSIPNAGVLSLSYDANRKESKLSGKHIVNVTAGPQDVLIYKFMPVFKSTRYTGGTNGTVNSFVGMRNTFKEEYEDSNGNEFVVWRVKAGQTATFDVSVSAPAKELFGGTYTLVLNGVLQIHGDSLYGLISSPQGTSNAVTVIGENIGTSGASIQTVDKGSLQLSYSNDKEASLRGSQRVNITAGSQDALIHVVNLSFENKEIVPVPPKGFEPNGTVRSFSAISGATKEKFANTDVWRIKAGKTASFNLSIIAPAKDMFAGGYRVSVANGVQVVNGGFVTFTEDTIKRISSDTVMVIGERANATSTSKVTIDTSLKPGQEGQQVTLLQQALKQIGVYSGEITGFFGNLTKQSVAEFQTANALDAVGEVGPKTRALLNSILNQ